MTTPERGKIFIRGVPVLLFAFAVSFTFFAIQSGDVLMYLALARDYFLHGEWPSRDPYLYSIQTDIHVTHEYLSYFAYYFAWKALGFAGLTLLKIALFGAIFVLALRGSPREANASPLWIGLWILAVLAGSFRFIERSSVFSDLFCVLLIAVLLERRQITWRLIAGLSALFLLWMQLHPGFPIGIAILGLWAGWNCIFNRAFARQRCAWLLVPCAMLLLNPLGWEGVYYPLDFALHQAPIFKRFNYEWFPTYRDPFRFTPEVLGYWGLMLGVLCLMWRERAWLTLRAWFCLFAAICGTMAVRFVPWASFALVLAAKPWATFRLERVKAPLRWTLCAFMLVITMRNFAFGYKGSSGPRVPRFGLDVNFFPLKTLAFLRAKPIPGRLYNAHDFGSYLIWEGYTPIFHHGFVTDVNFYYNDVVGVFKDQANFLALAKKYNWTMLLVDKHGSYPYFFKILSPLPDWKIVAEDDASYLIYLLPEAKKP